MEIIRSPVPASPFFITDADLVSSNVDEDEYSAYSSSNFYEAGDRVQSVSPSGTVTFTMASPCVMTWNNSQLPDNTIVRFTTTGTLLTGLLPNKNYYVKRKSDSKYTLSLRRNGTPITTSGTSSGTHTAYATRHDVYEAMWASFSSSGISISGTTMTVTSVASGFVRIGMIITGSGVSENTVVTAFLTGTGGNGTYKVSVSQSVSAPMSGTSPLTDVVSDTNPGAQWARADTTNPWKMHDNVVSSQTSNPDTIHNVYQLSSICDAAVLLDVDCQSVNIKIIDPTDGVVFDETKNGTTVDGITDYYKYCFEPIERKPDILFPDLPKYPNAQLEITITASAGKNALCGTFMFGKKLAVGNTQFGMQLGITDYSVKKGDSFGNQTVIERNFSRRVSLVTYIKNSAVDMIHDQLTSFRAIPAVYIGSSMFGASYVFGFYKEFNIEIPYPTESLCSIDIEGLT